MWTSCRPAPAFVTIQDASQQMDAAATAADARTLSQIVNRSMRWLRCMRVDGDHVGMRAAHVGFWACAAAEAAPAVAADRQSDNCLIAVLATATG
jgi:hypothetical protein